MANLGKAEIVDLSHVIENGMTTYKGLPGPQICDFWPREGSASNYDDGCSFQIGRIDMVANTGTGRAAEIARDGQLSGPRLRGARLSQRRLQPVGNDRVGKIVDSPVLDRQAELVVQDARALAFLRGGHHDQPSVDL